MAKLNKINTAFQEYKILSQIGEGGSGNVYIAEDEEKKKYAIKVLKGSNVSSSKRKRFKNEILFCMKDNNVNIIRVLDFGVVSGDAGEIPFYVMPFYDCTLRMLIENGIKPENIMRLFSQMLDGVEAVHLHGGFHRDIKPENFLYDSEKDLLVLADFGIAKFIEEELYTAIETKRQERLANFQYAAPEQKIRGGSVDKRTDIYALGLILNEMFTGEILQGTQYKKIISINENFSYLDPIVEKMVCQNPNDRFSSISEIKYQVQICGEEFISQQKISKLTSTVIPTTEIDDILITDPIKIVDFEWDSGNLVLILNHPVNKIWIDCFHNLGNFTSVYNKGPRQFRINGNKAMIDIDSDHVQDIINYFKSWLKPITISYAEQVEYQQQIKEERIREKIQEEIEAEQIKAELRKKIRL